MVIHVNGSNSPSDMFAFHIRRELSKSGPRLGELIVRDRPAISTPSLVASTSRGVVPHLTPDLFQKHTTVSVAYTNLEDFLEKSRTDAPIFHTPKDLAVQDSILRGYTTLPDRCVSILGPRRVPRLDTPHQNTNSSLAISTSFGFASLELEDYNEATWKLKPDVSTTAVDLVQEDRISRKRIERSADRTHAWLRDTVDEMEKKGISQSIFASIPPLEPEQQSFYLSDLADDFKGYLSGICVYEPATAALIPDTLGKLPVLCLSDPRGPHDVLSAISVGVDLLTTHFVTSTSEAGVALTFTFKPSNGSEREPLGVDMWSSSHTTDVSPLAPSCACYACTRHHRAYLHHLLQAKEMLAWTLLQIHNFYIVGQFFEHIRQSISNGTFEDDSKSFRLAYDTELPEKTGEGPRVRGYQVRSRGPAEPKKNVKGYNKFSDEQALMIEEAESGVASLFPEDDAEDLERQGLGRKVD